MDGNTCSALIGSFEGDNTWVIDSGASRHMTRECGQLKTLSKWNSSHSVELGDNNNYSVKGIGSTSFELESSGNIHPNNIPYVLGLKKKLLSISCLEDKGDRVEFVHGKVIDWK